MPARRSPRQPNRATWSRSPTISWAGSAKDLQPGQPSGRHGDLGRPDARRPAPRAAAQLSHSRTALGLDRGLGSAPTASWRNSPAAGERATGAAIPRLQRSSARYFQRPDGENGSARIQPAPVSAAMRPMRASASRMADWLWRRNPQSRRPASRTTTSGSSPGRATSGWAATCSASSPNPAGLPVADLHHRRAAAVQLRLGPHRPAGPGLRLHAAAQLLAALELLHSPLEQHGRRAHPRGPVVQRPGYNFGSLSMSSDSREERRARRGWRYGVGLDPRPPPLWNIGVDIRGARSPT